MHFVGIGGSFMLFEFSLSTPSSGMIDITDEVRNALKESGVNEGICIVYCKYLIWAHLPKQL